METNYEHYKDTIVKDAVFQGRHIALKESGEPVFCGHGFSCSECIFNEGPCSERRKEWLNAEYKEPVIEIDWEKVPVDTKILVKDQETNHWLRRYFAECENGFVRAFKSGTTSWSVDDRGTTLWKYAKLANEEDIEKHRKR